MEKNTNSLSARRAMLRRITVVGILSAVATILMFMLFSVPFMPSFIKLEISELPALLAAFAFGPVEGVLVCFLKNLVNVFFSTTGGVGELSNFLLGCAFVVPAGLIYKFGKNRRAALIGSMNTLITYNKEFTLFTDFKNAVLCTVSFRKRIRYSRNHIDIYIQRYKQ